MVYDCAAAKGLLRCLVADYVQVEGQVSLLSRSRRRTAARSNAFVSKEGHRSLPGIGGYGVERATSRAIHRVGIDASSLRFRRLLPWHNQTHWIHFLEIRTVCWSQRRVDWARQPGPPAQSQLRPRARNLVSVGGFASAPIDRQ